jgi:hypothetical protein
VGVPWQLGQRLFLEHDDSGGQFKRMLRFSIRLNILVNIGAGQYDDEREICVKLMKLQYRSVTASGVKRDQQIARQARVVLHDIDFVSETAQDPRPAHRGYLVAIVQAQWRGGGELYSHGAVIWRRF